MGKIQRMSPALANMIAAGEVVERPSSVVKEIVENAIDAHSTELKLYLKNAGLEEIKLIDNGDGMESDDVILAFVPHATSKIKNEYDLAHINTLGFRGEAIASIASVSKMTIISSTDGITGYMCKYQAGNKKECGIINSNKGTTVIVDELFFNTPARLKYMKAAKSELSSILFFINRIALAHMDIRFTVYNDDKIVFQTTGSNDYKTLIAEIYGIDAAKNIMNHSYNFDGYKMNLIFIKPSIYRSNKLEITLICNGRYVKNYNMAQAVIDGFKTYLPISKYPIGIMYLDIDPILIDVNVHPTKTEIKIASEEEMCEKLSKEIKKMLENYMHVPTRVIERNTNDAYTKTNIFDDLSMFDDKPILNEKVITYETKSINTNSDLEKKSINLDKKNNYERIQRKDDYNQVKIETADKINENNLVIETKNDNKLPFMQYVGQVFGTYLIFQSDEGMYLIDQHAAAERVNYEKYYKILSNNKQPSTELLIPIILSFSNAECLFIEQNITKFLEIGFELSQVSENSYAVRQLPLWAKLDDVDSIIYDILEMMIQNKKIDIMYFRDEICKQISCKASIKANHRISDVEIKTLLDNLNKCENPYCCPHGRPCIIKLSLTDIEKMFERIQK